MILTNEMHLCHNTINWWLNSNQTFNKNKYIRKVICRQNILPVWMANKDKIETSSFKFQLQRSSTSPLREYERMTANMVWYTFVSKNGTCSVRTIFRSFRFEFCTLVLRPNSMVGNLLFCTTSVDALHTWCCSYADWMEKRLFISANWKWNTIMLFG